LPLVPDTDRLLLPRGGSPTENSVHAVEQFRSQDAADLTTSLIENAKAQCISEADMKAEIGMRFGRSTPTPKSFIGKRGS